MDLGTASLLSSSTGGECCADYRVQSFDEEERYNASAKISAGFHNPTLPATLNTDIEGSKACQ